MTDKEIIKKATEALKAMDLYTNYTSISVNKDVNEFILEMDPETEN